MISGHPQSAGSAGSRVDGIDVAQLLRDLGEASATSGAVELFGLCLSAQRVLDQIIVADTRRAASLNGLEDKECREGESYAF